MRFLFILIVTCFWGINTHAQILNIEKNRLNNDSSEHLLGNIAAQFNIQKRTNTVISGQINSNLNYTTKQNVFIGIGRWHLVKGNGSDLISDGYIHFRSNWLRRRTVSYENFIQGQYDGIRGMNHRYLLGSNVRIELRDSDKTSFIAGIGGMMEWEEWKYEDELFQSEFFKANLYLMLHKQLGSSLSINMGGYYQATIKNFFLPRMTGDLHINIKITNKLSFTSKFSLTYDALPIVPINDLIYTWQNGILYSF